MILATGWLKQTGRRIMCIFWLNPCHIQHPQTKLVNSLKGVSSRFLRKEFPELEKYYWKGGLWSPSYFIASCGGAPLDIVKEYIEKQ